MRSGWVVLAGAIALACAGCAVDEPNPAIPDEMRRSLALVEGDLAMFDELLGEPDYQATTDERCLDDDLYETRSYRVQPDDTTMEEIRDRLEAFGWDIDDSDPSASTSWFLAGSAERGDDRIDIRVSRFSDPEREAISVDVLFRSLAAELCPN